MVVVSGSQYAASQYHYYMETQSAMAFPTEQGGMKMYASSQSPTFIQSIVAKACDLPINQVIVEVQQYNRSDQHERCHNSFSTFLPSPHLPFPLP